MPTQKASEIVLHRDDSSTTRIHLSDQMQNVTVGDEFKRVNGHTYHFWMGVNC